MIGGMLGPGRQFWRVEIAIWLSLALALLAISVAPAWNMVSIPIGVGAFVGLWIIGRLNDDPPDH